jgi:hypothetical protein
MGMYLGGQVILKEEGQRVIFSRRAKFVQFSLGFFIARARQNKRYIPRQSSGVFDDPEGVRENGAVHGDR